jgi:hypothetical protein
LRARFPTIVSAFCLLCSALFAAAQVPISAPPIPVHEQRISFEELRVQLDRLHAQYEAGKDNEHCCDARPADVPDVWVVTINGRDYRLSMDFFLLQPYESLDDADGDVEAARDEAGKKKDHAAAAERHRLYVLARLEALKNSLDSLASGPQSSKVAQANDKAKEILARGEFRRVRVPGIRESWTDKILSFLQDLLSRIFRNAPNVRVVSRVVVWVAIAIALIVFGLWLKRFLTREETAFHVPRPSVTRRRASKRWEEWLAEARAAAARGDWREAVHLTYWASVGRLESIGAWRLGEEHTPRELVRLLPAGVERSSLEDITRHFERSWYAQKETKEEDYRAVDAAMEQLCRK